MPPGWRSSTRPRILARDPSCKLALVGCTITSTEVHHAIPGRDDDAALIGVCHSCHAIVTRLQSLDARGIG